MKSRKGPMSLVVIGSVLAISPLWGLLGTVIGMLRAFAAAQQSTPVPPEHLASNVSLSLLATAAGVAISPIGLALLIGGIIWFVRINKQEKASNQQIQTIAAKRGSV